MTTARARTWLGLVAAALGCRPDLGDRESLVTRPQVLAIRAEPAEAPPGSSVSYSLLVATPAGPSAAPLASWAFCMTPKRLTDNGAVSSACLGEDVLPLADGAADVVATIPEETCRVFGPEVTSADLRPRDPDATGGYFLPLRVVVPGFADEESSVAFGLQRVACNLANAPADVARAFGERYLANRNPELLPLTARRGADPASLESVPRGQRLTLRAAWTSESQETYVAYDLGTQRLASRRETLRVSWFATAGSFANDRTGREEAEAESFSENDWTAPRDARSVHLFVVLRDARGGVAFGTHDLTIR